MSTPSTSLPPAEPASSWAVQTTDLTRDYSGKGLFEVSFRVPRGSVYGLVGPNGSGNRSC